MFLSQLLKSKIHHARVSYANPEYVGSIEIDRKIMEHVGLQDGELVHVWSVDHLSRIETYVFGGPAGVVGINGGAAHHFKADDRIIVAAFALTDESIIPKMVLLGENNEIVSNMTPFSVTGV